MALEFIDYEIRGITVLRPIGRLTLGESTAKFRSTIREWLETGKKKIILDMSEVYFIDSSGLGELVTAHTTAVKHGGALKLLKLTQRVQDLVQLTKVYRVLEVFTEEDVAVDSFAAPAEG
jgi:anti-sigma B factor antagonist